MSEFFWRINLRKHRKGGQLKDKIDIEIKQEQWQPIINLEYPEVSKLKEGGQLEESKEWTPIISLDTSGYSRLIIGCHYS